MTDALSDPVPVQMTSIVPVRVVSVHGDFFDTELHLDAPLRVLQRAVEDCFKVRPELQLLTHNRQPIHTKISLRRNGCLLLKGDPYVKIVLDVKKGTKLNIVCQLMHQEPIPIACDATDTVWELKKKFCAALTKPDVTPQRIRLLWRYWELNDKATLEYYHLPTNAKLSVMRKRGFVPRRTPTPSLAQPQQNQHGNVDREAEPVFFQPQPPPPLPPAPSAAATVMMMKPIPIETITTPATSPTIDVSTVSRTAVPWHAPLQQMTGRAVIPIESYTTQQQQQQQQQRSLLSSSSSPNPLPHMMQPSSPAKHGAPFALANVNANAAVESMSLAELVRVKQEITALERRLDSATGRNGIGYDILEASHRATLGRIRELEDTVGRFQHLLQRALALM